MTIASEDSGAGEKLPSAQTPQGEDSLQDTRYRAYERVFSALSGSAASDDPPLTSSELSYRQHAVIETLRDLELSRRRFLLLHQGDNGQDGDVRGDS